MLKQTQSLDSLMETRIEYLVERLNEEKEKDLTDRGMTNLVGRHYDDFHVTKIARKFIYLDRGGSGCFLIERETGELYNIMGYGKPDNNKHRKAPLGNVATVHPARLYALQYNYLR